MVSISFESALQEVRDTFIYNCLKNQLKVSEVVILLEALKVELLNPRKEREEVSKLILLPSDQQGMGIYSSKDVICTSRAVSEIFGKRHDHVLRDVEKILEDLGDPRFGGIAFDLPKSGEIKSHYFIKSVYKDDQNRKYPEYLLTRDGFTLLAMGFTGKKALKFKIAYINRFNEMEQALKDRQLARMECRQLTDAIKTAHDPAKPYHFSNEMNMLLVIVSGKNAKQLKQGRNLPDDAAVRDYLKPDEISLLAKLQPVAAFLNASNVEYAERKKLLTEYAKKLKTPELSQSA